MKRISILLLSLIVVFCNSLGVSYARELVYKCTSEEEFDRDYEELSITYNGIFPYENIEFLGEFDGFYLWDDGSYICWIKCPSGGRHQIIYEPLSPGSTLEERMPGRKATEQEAEKLFTNRIFHGEEVVHAPCYYRIGNFYYRYSYDHVYFSQLTQIFWCSEDGSGVYSIRFLDQVGKCDFCKEVVNLDTAESALNRLAKATSDSDESLPWLWIALPVGAVVIVGAAFVLFRKKRKISPTP